jgi:carbon starvation protein CstA
MHRDALYEMLAVIAMLLGTTVLIKLKRERERYAWVTLMPGMASPDYAGGTINF